MKSYIINKDENKYFIEIEYKKVKNYNIRILPDNKIKCSVPIGCTDKEITDFLKNKKGWLYKHNIKQSKIQHIQNKNILKQGGNVKILGHYYNVYIENASKNSVQLNDNKIIFHLNTLNNIENVYQKYSRQKMNQYFQQVIDKYYPIIKRHGQAKPVLKIRKMKQCWGTSSQINKCITINEYLYMALPFCIEYVILHELTHFLYPYHDKNFYNFISIYMPDWKERRDKLNMEFNV